VTEPKVLSEPIEDADAVGVRVGGAIGVGSVEIAVGSINSHGAFVPGPPLNLTASGDGFGAQEIVSEPDSLGLGRVSLASGGSSAISVQAGEDADAVAGSSWIFGRAPTNFSFLPGYSGQSPSDRAVAWADSGLVYALGGEIYSQPESAGAPRNVLATLDTDVQGILAGDIDADGHDDLLAWTAEEVILLRGRGLLGYAWAGGFTVPGGSITDAALGDIDQDGILDVGLSYGLGQSGGVEVLQGDGIWGFEAIDPLAFARVPYSITFGDFSGDGVSEVAVLFEGVITRYGFDSTAESHRWSLTGQDLNADLPLGSYLGPTADVDGDGIVDLFAYGPEVETGSRDLLFYTLASTPTVYNLGFNAYYHHVADLSGDGVADIVHLELSDAGEPVLRTVTSDTDDGAFRNRSLASMPAFGPILVDTRGGDAVPSIALAAAGVRVYPGTRNDEGDWIVNEYDMNSFAVDSLGGIHVEDVNADGWADALVVRDSGGRAWFKHYRFTGVAGTSDIELRLKNGGEVDVDTFNETAQATFVDMDYCKLANETHPTVFVLVEDGERALIEVTNTVAGSSWMRSESALPADYVACGDFANGAELAGATSDGTITYYNQGGWRQPYTVQSSESGGASAGGIAAWNPDGLGLVAVVCEGECSIVGGDLDGDGVDELARSDENGIVVDGWGESIALDGNGDLSMLDIDGSGTLDLVATDTDTGAIHVWRTVGQGLAPGLSWHTRQPVDSAGMLGDVNADGTIEMLFGSRNGTLLYSRPSGG